MFKFPADLTYVKEASKKVLDSLSDLRLDSSTLFDIKLCFEEAFINAAKYGNKGDCRLTVDVEVVKGKDKVEVIVCDQGEGFNPAHLNDPTQEEHLDKPSGRGVFLIKALMDRVVFENNGSCLRMIKKIK